MNPDSTEPPKAPVVHRVNNRKRPRKWLPYLGAVILVGLIVVGLWPQPVPVELATVSVGPLRATVNEEGRTRVRQRFLVSAPISGQLRCTPFRAGAEVETGKTVVAVIDPLSPALLDARSRSLAEARRDTATTNLDKARAGHKFAASELRRFQQLYKDKTVSIQELESVQWREEAAARDMAAAESALRQAEAELAEFSPGQEGVGNSTRGPTEVKAPASGRVLRVFEESARVVTPGTPLMEIGDPADLEVVIEVLSRDGATISPGTPVEFDQWGGNELLAGRVRLVEPAAFTKISALGVEEQRVNVIVDFVTPPEQWRNLGDHFRVESRIIVWESKKTLKVPNGALFRRGEEWVALVVNDNRAHTRSVRIGRSSGVETQVLDGLVEMDVVILYPGDRVREGQRVKPIKI